MNEAIRERNAEIDREYWSDDGRRTAYTRTDVLRYARLNDAAAFFELLEDNAGDGRGLDELIDDYASENDDTIQEFVDYD